MGDIRGFFRKGTEAKKKKGGLGLSSRSRKRDGRGAAAEKPASKTSAQVVSSDEGDEEDFVDLSNPNEGSGSKKSDDRRGKGKGKGAGSARKKVEGKGRKRKRVDDNEDEDWKGDEEVDDDVETVLTERKKRRVSRKSETADEGKSATVEDGETKKRSTYNVWKSRAPPPNLGKKPLPKGAEDCLQGKVFVITGVLDSLERGDAQDLIKEYGGRVVSGVSKKVTHAVVGSEGGESKMKKIKQNSIAVIDEDGLFAMINSTYKEPSRGSGEPELMETDSEKKEPLSASKTTLSAGVKPAPRKSVIDVGEASKGPELWVDKYKPQTEKDLCANPGHVKTLKQWLTTWKQKFLRSSHEYGDANPSSKTKRKKGARDKEEPRAALLAGPPGIGKTTFAHIISKAAGFEPHELNASDTRNRHAVAHLAGEITLAYSISKYLKISDSSRTSKQEKGTSLGKGECPNGQVLIMDEVDGMSSGDRGGMQELIKVIKTTRVPIICICNDDTSQKVRGLANHCLKLKFRRPMVSQVVKRLSAIAQREGFRATNKQTFEKIAESCHGDIRQMINLLQSWRSSSSSLSFSDVKNRLKMEGKTFEDISIFEVASSFFRGGESIANRLDSYFVDSDLLPLFVQDAYINSNSAAGSLDALAGAADSISEGDLCSAILRENQRWDLMPSHGILSTVAPSWIASGLSARIGFPQWLGRSSAERKARRLNMELDLRTKATTLCASPRAFRIDYVPALTRCFAMPLITEQQDGIPEAIELMDTYLMTRADFDTLLELGVFPKGQSPQENINPKVKSALTKVYKSEEHRVGEASDVHVGRKAKGKVQARQLMKRDGELDIADAGDEEQEDDESEEEDGDDEIGGLVKQVGPAKKGKKKTAVKRQRRKD